MLDLETLDLGCDAVVTAIGAVAFDPRGNGMMETFYAVLNDLPAQQKAGGTIGGNTVLWWFGQSEDARSELYSPRMDTSMTTAAALQGFTEFVGDGMRANIWGNGADFDNVILRNLYTRMGYKRPWTYGDSRCYRTIKNLPNAPRAGIPLGTAHNALDDAINQAHHLQQIYKALNL